MKNINRNSPNCDEYKSDSFIGLLHEKCVWSDDEYFKLDKELYQLAEKYHGVDNLPRELVWRLMKIFNTVMSYFVSHFDLNDGFELKHLENDEVYNRKERFCLVIEGLFQGVMPEVRFFNYEE